MIAYKYLGAGGVGLFSGFAWPLPDGGPGPWVDAGGPLEPCRTGVHACRRGHLLDWIDDELWTVELDGPHVEVEAAVVARRGRLVARVDGWTPAAARELAESATWRAAGLAARALDRAGSPRHAGRVAAARDLGELRSRAEAAAAAVPAAEDAAAFAADAVALLAGARPGGTEVARLAPPTPAAIAANVAFVVAHAAGCAAEAEGLPGGYAEGRAAERAWQLARLEGLIGLTGAGADPG